MLAAVDEARDAVFDLCRKYRVSRLDVFGSATRSDFEPGRSDVDFVVEFFEPSEDAGDRYLGLMIDLQDVLGVPVDLVSYRGIRNPVFRSIVDQTRVRFYAA